MTASPRLAPVTTTVHPLLDHSLSNGRGVEAVRPGCVVQRLLVTPVTNPLGPDPDVPRADRRTPPVPGESHPEVGR